MIRKLDRQTDRQTDVCMSANIYNRAILALCLCGEFWTEKYKCVSQITVLKKSITFIKKCHTQLVRIYNYMWSVMILWQTLKLKINKALDYCVSVTLWNLPMSTYTDRYWNKKDPLNTVQYPIPHYYVQQSSLHVKTENSTLRYYLNCLSAQSV